MGLFLVIILITCNIVVGQRRGNNAIQRLLNRNRGNTNQRDDIPGNANAINDVNQDPDDIGPASLAEQALNDNDVIVVGPASAAQREFTTTSSTGNEAISQFPGNNIKYIGSRRDICILNTVAIAK